MNWTNDEIITVSTEAPEHIQKYRKPPNIKIDSLSILCDLLKQKKPPIPIIVFCMRKIDAFELAHKYANDYCKASGHSSAFNNLPVTLLQKISRFCFLYVLVYIVLTLQMMSDISLNNTCLKASLT